MISCLKVFKDKVFQHLKMNKMVSMSMYVTANHETFGHFKTSVLHMMTVSDNET